MGAPIWKGSIYTQMTGWWLWWWR